MLGASQILTNLDAVRKCNKMMRFVWVSGGVLTSGDFPEHFGGHEILKPLGVVAGSVYGDTVL